MVVVVVVKAVHAHACLGGGEGESGMLQLKIVPACDAAPLPLPSSPIYGGGGGGAGGCWGVVGAAVAEMMKRMCQIHGPFFPRVTHSDGAQSLLCWWGIFTQCH